MAEIYRSRLASLHEALGREETRIETAEIIRPLVNEIVFTPEGGELKVDLRGRPGGHPGDRCKRKEAGPSRERLLG
jgi:site-specific DNA recombinase